MSDRINITTKFLPQLLQNLDSLLLDQEAKIPVSDYIQIGLLIKIAELLNEIKYELKNPKARLDFGPGATRN